MVTKVPTFAALQVIFGELFLLPSCTAPMYYFCLVAELIRTTPGAPEAVASTLDLVFENLEVLDVECAGRFAMWMAHLVNRFGFTGFGGQSYNWAAWVTTDPAPVSGEPAHVPI